MDCSTKETNEEQEWKNTKRKSNNHKERSRRLFRRDLVGTMNTVRADNVLSVRAVVVNIKQY